MFEKKQKYAEAISARDIEGNAQQRMLSGTEAFTQLLQLLRPFRWLILGAALLGAATILANVGLLAVSAVLISLAALQPPLLDLMVYIVGVRFFGISRALLRYTERYVTHDITLRILSKLRVDIYERMEPHAPAGLQMYSNGQLFQRLLGDIETLKFFYLRAVVAPVAALAVLVTCSIFLGQFLPVAAWLLVALLLFFGLVLPWWMGKRSLFFTEGLQEEQEQWQTELTDYLEGLAELQSNQQTVAYQQRLLLRLQQVESLQTGLNRWNIWTTNLLSFGSYAALWLTLLLAVPAVVQGNMPGIYLAMVILVVWSSFEAIIPFPQALVQLQQSLAAAKRVFALPARDNSFTEAAAEHSECPLTNYDLKLTKVDFSYQQKRKPLYQQFSLDCPHGSHVAFVGSSGSGKSTLVQLLLKFHQPEAGGITLGGVPLRELSDRQVRQAVGVVLQEPYLFHATVRENLLLANPQATDEQLQAALTFASLREIVAQLPQGMETILGENGFRLSGGQRQRIALARVYLQDTPIVILDEVFQGLDTITTETLAKQIRQWGKKKTVISITHQLQGLTEQDCIYVLEQGKIVESGTLQELLQQKGKFYKMYQLEQQSL